MEIQAVNGNEAPQQPEDQLSLLNFSFESCGFEYSLSNGLDFDDEDFTSRDGGQHQDQPSVLDEVDLLGRLRDTNKRDSILVPPILYEFYDKCKAHFTMEFVELLAGYIANIEAANRLKNANTDGRLLNFFDIQLKPLNFGTKHQTFIDGASECDDEIKSKLKECGKELQKIAQDARVRTVTAARTKLQACNIDFAKFGSALWRELCCRTSLKNILDQHFTVRSITNTTVGQDRDDESEEFQDALPNSSSTRYLIWPMSTWLYNAAIHDSKKAVDIEIRKRRAQKILAEAETAQIRARQALVDIRADAVRPEDAAKMLGDRFRQIDREVAEIKVGMASISTSTNASDRGQTRVSAATKARPNHDQQAASKNDTQADSAESAQPATNARDVKKHHHPRPASQRTVMHAPAPRPTRPPSQDHANANDNEGTSRHQRARPRNSHGSPAHPKGHGQNQRQGQNQRGRQDRGQQEDNVRHSQDEDWSGQRRNPGARRGRGYGNGRGRGHDRGEEY